VILRLLGSHRERGLDMWTVVIGRHPTGRSKRDKIVIN
jgi:hypothetical protein